MILARYIDEHGRPTACLDKSDNCDRISGIIYAYALPSALRPAVPPTVYADLAALRSASAVSNQPLPTIAVPFTAISQHACGSRCLRAAGRFSVLYDTCAPASDAAACAARFGIDYFTLCRVLRDTPCLALAVPPIAAAAPHVLLSFCRRPDGNAAAYLDRLANDVTFFRKNAIIYPDLQL